MNWPPRQIWVERIAADEDSIANAPECPALLLALFLVMDPTERALYESLLSEDSDWKDRWWFLGDTVESDVTTNSGDNVDGLGSDLTKETTAVTSEPKIESETPYVISSGLCLGERETAMVDSFCTEYGGTPQFRRDLMNHMLLVLSLQEVPRTNAVLLLSPNSSVSVAFSSSNVLLFTVLISFVACYFIGRIYGSLMNKSKRGVRASGVRRNNAGEAEDKQTRVDEAVVDGLLEQEFSGICSLDSVSREGSESGEQGPTLEDETHAAWTDWYDNMTEEIEHNLECWSPR